MLQITGMWYWVSHMVANLNTVLKVKSLSMRTEVGGGVKDARIEAKAKD